MQKLMSPYNGGMNNPGRIIFSDTTMREGEQCPGVVFTLDEKKELMRRLSACGISQIQFYPGKTAQSKQDVKTLSSLDVNADVMVMALGFEDCWKENIDFSLECNTGINHCSFYSSRYVEPNWCEDTPKITLDRMQEAIEYIKSQSNRPIEITLIDATRAEEKHLIDLVNRAADAGANRISICDTVGAANPEGMYRIVKTCADALSSYPDIILGAHCHNDFGVALANTLMSIKAGAKMVDVAVNGMGDRAGNAALAEVAVALEAFYDIDTGIDLKQMRGLSQFVAKVSGRPLPVNMPLVGDHVFIDQDDYHIESQLINPLAFKGIRAEEVGGQYGVMFGKLTGPAAIGYMAKKYNRPINGSDIPAIRSAIYEEAAKSKKGVCLGEDAFWRIVSEAEARIKQG